MPADVDRARAEKKSADSTRYTDEAVLDALRRCAREVGTAPRSASINAYVAWRAGQAEGVPSPQRIEQRLGSWTAAAEAAGLVPNAATGPTRITYTREVCAAALRECAEAFGHVPSTTEYSDFAWREDGGKGKRDPDAPPSLVQLKARIGPLWTDCLEAAGLLS